MTDKANSARHRSVDMTLSRLLNNMNKVNQYDYKEMLKEFKLEEKQEKKSKEKVII